MYQQQRSAAEELESARLPQSFRDQLDRPELSRKESDTQQKEDIKALIRTLAIKSCKVFNSESDLFELNLGTDAQEAAKSLSASGGYELCDNRCLEGLKYDRISLVSVFFVAVPGGKNGELMPVVRAHEHPEKLGDAIKNAIYRHYFDTAGATPEQMLKNAEEARHKRLQRIGKGLLLVAVGGAGGYAAINYGPEAYQVVSTTVQEWKTERDAQREREHQQRLVEVDKVIATLNTNPLTTRGILDALTGDHYDSIGQELQSGEPERQLKAIATITYLSKAELAAQEREGIRDAAERDGFTEAGFVAPLLDAISNSSSPEVRTQAANGIYELRQFVKAELE